MRHALALALLCLVARPALAQPEAPYVAMRTLQVLQEQIAHGDATAQAAQPQLMAHIADGFLAADPAVWKDVRNARAAILFLLSGGSPAAVRTVLGKTLFPADLDRLLKGALAYGEGQDDIARALLDGVDPQKVPSALGGHVALVKGGLFADRAPAKAIASFDMARLLAPGTLIEEAALRREVFVLIESGALDKGMTLARQYIRRFHGSSYAGNFKQRFAAMAATVAAAGDTSRLEKLDSVLSDMPVNETRSFYLALARASVLDGTVVAARFAAEKALALAGPTSPEAVQAKLYRAAALVVADDSVEGMTALEALPEAPLSPEDRALRNAALAIGKAIQADGPSASGTEPAPLPNDPAQGVITRARNALAEGDRLVGALSQ